MDFKDLLTILIAGIALVVSAAVGAYTLTARPVPIVNVRSRLESEGVTALCIDVFNVGRRSLPLVGVAIMLDGIRRFPYGPAQITTTEQYVNPRIPRTISPGEVAVFKFDRGFLNGRVPDGRVLVRVDWLRKRLGRSTGGRIRSIDVPWRILEPIASPLPQGRAKAGTVAAKRAGIARSKQTAAD